MTSQNCNALDQGETLTGPKHIQYMQYPYYNEDNNDFQCVEWYAKKVHKFQIQCGNCFKSFEGQAVVLQIILQGRAMHSLLDTTFL